MPNTRQQIWKYFSLRQAKKGIRKISRGLILGFVIFSIHLLAEQIFQFELPPFVVNFIQQPYIFKQEEEVTLATFQPFKLSTTPYPINVNKPRPAHVVVSNSRDNSRTIVMSKNGRKSYERGFSYPLDIDLERMVNDNITRGLPIPAKPNNTHPFKYIHSPPECQFNKKGQNILILVKSATQNRVLRHGIRHSWANISLTNVRIVFLLAELKNQQSSVDREMQEYDDIVQENLDRVSR